MPYIQPPERDPKDFLPGKYPKLAFPESDWKAFRDDCAALKIDGADAHRATLEALYSHLVGVNEWLNLTRLSAPADYLKFQVLDSLSILNTIGPMLEETDTVVDLGSGGGYPGLPLMTWLTRQSFVLIDARQKKVQFLSATIPLIPREGKASAVACRGREIAQVRADLEHHAAIVTARAVGKGVDVLEDAAALLATGGVLVLMKGQSWPTEEGPAFADACPAFGFEQMDDVQFSLVPGDPIRHVILAVKKGREDLRKLRRIPHK